MKLTFAAAAILIAASAVGAPAIEDDALKAALQKGMVKVVSFERHLGPPAVQEGGFVRACRNWNLTEAEVLSFFAQATAITSDDLRSNYSVMPCQYAGSLAIGDKRYQFSINIGRFGFIRGASADSVVLFGCEDGCRELFVIDAAGT
jgi:hypothetical protein